MSPEVVVLGATLVALTLYALLGGADFGAGIWEFNTALHVSPRERALLRRAIGPVWEANHVWLIFVLVALFTAFPLAFAAVCRALWLPLLLGLLGIVFRGAAFAFRSVPSPDEPRPFHWETLFALASTAAPFFLGASAWAIASGRLDVDRSGGHGGDPLLGWLNPMSIFGAFFAVATCAYLAAVYLARDARREEGVELAELWRRRALVAGAWMGLLSAAGLALVATAAPVLWEGFRGRAAPVVLVSGLGGLSSLGFLLARRETAAVVGAATAVGGVVLGWGVAQYPAIVPPSLTVEGTKAPEAVLRPLAIGMAAGAALLVPSLGFLFYLFKGKRPAA
ncbi:MAG TPA: cytochrome d ubiquinol oxidase subunit II [Planctomycetota bacterium]|nr:cytochrome d ubiquinol oxidase subunit II [Planctomycetota bacterium]